MNLMKPAGCLTCYEALDEIIKDEVLMGEYVWRAGYFPSQWEATFITTYANPIDGLDDFDSHRMRKAAMELQRQLVHGERVACYIGRNAIEDAPPHAFVLKGSAEKLVRGRFIHFELEQEIFIRGMRGGSATSKRKHAPKRLQLARDYWMIFPKGHQEAGRTKQQACGDLEEKTDRQNVPLSSLNDALADYPSPQHLP